MINQKVQTESKKKLKKVRSIRLARLSSMRSSTPIEVVDASPNYMKGTSSSHAKDNFQITEKVVTKKILTRVSTLKLKRSVTRKNRKNDNDDGNNKSKRVIARRLSLKPVRILNRIPTFKSKNSSMMKGSSRLHKSTCSSALKGSHFPDHIDVPQEGSDSQGESSKKVCPYSYCSLHGHRHKNSPPLKRFVSMRRRQLKSQQKSVKTDGRSKQFGNARKVSQKTERGYSEDGDLDLQNRSDFEVSDEIEWSDKNMINDESASVESTVTDAVVKFSVSEGKNIEQDCKVLQKRDQKYIKMWQLMYKNAVLSNTGKCENVLPCDGKEKKGKEEDVLASDGSNYFETDQDMDDGKKNVIELVQKAFDEILLPEVEDFSSPVPLLSEKSEGTREERNGNDSAFTESPEEAKKMETISEQRAPKSWSHLKKVILLKRFVKALEKVRNVNLQRPRQLPLDATFEAEKVLLKQQTAEERKKAEEWMLDYALQNVISKLAPAQRQRVTLLIEAFETILPTQDAENGLSRTDPIQSHDASLDHAKEETDKGRDYVYSAKTFLGKTSYSHNSTRESAANAGDKQMPELHNPIELKVRFLDYLETEKIQNNQESSGFIEEDLDGKQSLARSYNNGEKISIDNDNIYHVEDAQTEETVNEVTDKEARTEEIVNEGNDEEARTEEIVDEVPEDLISNMNTENVNIKSESPVRYSETKNVIGGNKEEFSVSKSLLLNGLVRSLRSNLVGSEAPSNELDEPTIDTKEMTEKAELETKTLEEKQGNKGLWYMVYKHMVSDATENNSSSLTDGDDEKESRNEGDRTREASVFNESTPVNVINQDMHLKDRVVADSDVELRQLEAIKMVEEAIDSILPDVQDNLPDNTISDDSSKQGLSQKKESVESGSGTAQEQEGAEEEVTKEGSKPVKPMSRSWSNLKKVILLRRFIKALEKVRKFNPRGPRFLPVENDPEAEKVELRHQDMAERKGTEEWMLDYALRQVVSKLTPARKRKVELLVEAFETVAPTIKN